MLGMQKTISHAGLGKDYLLKLFDNKYSLCSILLLLLLLMIIIIIIIIIIVKIIIIIIVIITVIHPSKFSAIQVLRKHMCNMLSWHLVCRYHHKEPICQFFRCDRHYESLDIPKTKKKYSCSGGGHSGRAYFTVQSPMFSMVV